MGAHSSRSGTVWERRAQVILLFVSKQPSVSEMSNLNCNTDSVPPHFLIVILPWRLAVCYPLRKGKVHFSFEAELFFNKNSINNLKHVNIKAELVYIYSTQPWSFLVRLLPVCNHMFLRLFEIQLLLLWTCCCFKEWCPPRNSSLASSDNNLLQNNRTVFNTGAKKRLKKGRNEKTSKVKF